MKKQSEAAVKRQHTRIKALIKENKQLKDALHKAMSDLAEVTIYADLNQMNIDEERMRSSL